jgi:HSP20 family protein
MAEVKEAPKPKTENGRGHSKEVVPRAASTPMATGGMPFAFLQRFMREMDHLFDDFGMETGWHMPRLMRRGRQMVERDFARMHWSPRVDVFQREGRFVIRADLPGLSKDDVKVEVGDEMITIEGERKHEHKEDREGCHYSECSYGSFYRAIPLPEGAEAAKATAEFHSGVLEVSVPAPTRSEQKPRRLEVKEKK